MSTNIIYNRQQLYGEYTSEKYPLDDTVGTPLPDDVLIDAAFTLLPGISSVQLTAAVRKASFVYLCFESGSEPVGHVFVQNPRPFTIYPATMFDGRCAGWVVFGPGIGSRAFEFTGIALAMDPRCHIRLPASSTAFELEINGLRYDMPDVLHIETNYYAAVSEGTRTVRDRPDTYRVRQHDALTLGRADINITDATRRRGLIDRDFQNLPITSINGIAPDADGNIELTMSSAAGGTAELKPVQDIETGSPLGLVAVTTGIAACDDPYKNLLNKIKPGKSGHGVPYDLPLDDLIPYESSSSSSSDQHQNSSSSTVAVKSSSSSSLSSSESPAYTSSSSSRSSSSDFYSTSSTSSASSASSSESPLYLSSSSSLSSKSSSSLSSPSSSLSSPSSSLSSSSSSPSSSLSSPSSSLSGPSSSLSSSSSSPSSSLSSPSSSLSSSSSSLSSSSLSSSSSSMSSSLSSSSSPSANSSSSSSSSLSSSSSSEFSAYGVVDGGVPVVDGGVQVVDYTP